MTQKTVSRDTAEKDLAAPAGRKSKFSIKEAAKRREKAESIQPSTSELVEENNNRFRKTIKILGS